MENYVKDGTDVTVDVHAQQDGSIALPLFAFEGYEVTVDGKETAYSVGEKNRLTVHLPAGTQGHLRVRFVGKTLWRIADGVSLVSMLALAAYVIKKHRAAALRAKNMQM